MTAQINHDSTGVTQVVHSQPATVSGKIREVIVEEPIAIAFNGSSAAVMMGTPSDIRDLAYGFALTEGYVSSIQEIESFEVIRHDKGFEAQLWVTEDRADAIAARRRAMAGPVGCGLCGIESLEQVAKSLPKAPARLNLSPSEISKAMAEISDWQPLKERTRSTHAAGFYAPGKGIIMAREDVGRHNALDKLVGALVQEGVDTSKGAVAVTSRISLELVQKCAVLGSPLLIAASGPTSLAIETARACGLGLIGFCRGEDYEIFC